MQDKTEGAVRTLSSRASKWAPTWHSSPITPKSLSGQPLDRVWIRLARKGFWGNGWAMSCGGSFRSSWWERSHSAFSFVLHFFTILTLPSERCVHQVKFPLCKAKTQFENGKTLVENTKTRFFTLITRVDYSRMVFKKAWLVLMSSWFFMVPSDFTGIFLCP